MFKNSTSCFIFYVVLMDMRDLLMFWSNVTNLNAVYVCYKKEIPFRNGISYYDNYNLM